MSGEWESNWKDNCDKNEQTGETRIEATDDKNNTEVQDFSNLQLQASFSHI